MSQIQDKDKKISNLRLSLIRRKYCLTPQRYVVKMEKANEIKDFYQKNGCHIPAVKQVLFFIVTGLG